MKDSWTSGVNTKQKHTDSNSFIIKYNKLGEKGNSLAGLYVEFQSIKSCWLQNYSLFNLAASN